MSTVILDATTTAKLLAAGAAVEVRDEAGNVIGRFVPAGDKPAVPHGYVIEGDWPSDEELARRETGKQYTAAEVEAFLAGMRRARA